MASARTADLGTGSRMRRPARGRVLLAVVLIGCVVTAASAWVAATLDSRNERDLLTTSTQQAALAISGAVLSVKDPLAASLAVAEATSGDTTQFRAHARRLVGPGATFVSVSLWDVVSGVPRVVDAVGASPELDVTSPQASSFISHAAESPTFVVTTPGRSTDRVSYAVGDTSDRRFVVYAERAIPASRMVPLQAAAPFSDLWFATYIGPHLTPSALATTNVPESQLPLPADAARERIPFGDTTITLVAVARDHLGGDLGRWLPWVFLLGGAVITTVAALSVRQIERARRRAESDRATIAELYRKQDALYKEQRSISETLQRALLPARNPTIPGVAVASRYLPGVLGVEIGGDWYSMIRIDDDRFAFVVGDVSGRGVSAASIMARMRFTIRAYLAEGHSPDAALALSARQLDVSADNHFATVLVGVADPSDRTLHMASAGHFSPLVLTGTHAYYPRIIVGPPLGVAATWPYKSTVVSMPEGSTLLAFTDGLIERRGEVIDAGLERLAKSAAAHDGSPDVLLDTIVEELGTESEDDIALLAFQW